MDTTFLDNNGKKRNIHVSEASYEDAGLTSDEYIMVAQKLDLKPEIDGKIHFRSVYEQEYKEIRLKILTELYKYLFGKILFTTLICLCITIGCSYVGTGHVFVSLNVVSIITAIITTLSISYKQGLLGVIAAQHNLLRECK